MRRVLVCAVSTTLALAGCNGDKEFTDSLPTAEQVAINVPDHGGTSTSTSQASVDGIGSEAQALLGQTAELYEVTRGVSATVNGGTVLVLGALRLITLTTPSSRTADSRTWGPHQGGGLDPLTYKLIVRKLEPGHFGFSLEASSKLAADPSAFLPLVDGEITRGERAGTGAGTMVLHFDNRRTLVPDACEDGTLAFDFDNTGDTVRNDVSLHRFSNENAKNILCRHDRASEAAYHFEQDRLGAGNFIFSFMKDMVQPAGQTASLEENATIRSRWEADGAGRSDVVVDGGDVAIALAAHGLTGPVTGSQCWDSRYQSVYETSAPAELHVFDPAGQASACAYTSAELP